jgi:hypothetical protein
MKGFFFFLAGFTIYQVVTQVASELTPPQPTAQELQQLQQQRFEQERALQRDRILGQTINQAQRSQSQMFSNLLTRPNHFAGDF